MTSLINVNSNVVPIDISGKSFSRMASFRRSLIHVDFLIRRKKRKDKRRNTVAEGEAKDALNKFIANQNQYTENSNSFPGQKLITASENFNKQNYQENVNDITERNNNTNPMKNSKYLTENERDLRLEDKVISSSQVESKYSDTSMKLPCGKRKSKSNIPISTISAAMSVAVEMRQSNGNKSDDHSSSGNWSCSSDQNSSDSDKKASLNNNLQKYLYIKENSKTSENLSHCKERFKARSLSTTKQKITSPEKYEDQDPEVSSSTSSEIDKFHGDDITSTNTSTESDAFFISSDESDEYLSDISFSHEKYRSSTSLSTLSDRSLNSLLSQTGSEITSSTGTLTSIGEEKFLMPPPPPKTVAASILLENENDVQVNLISKKCDTDKKLLMQNLPKKSKKLKISNKQSQPLKEVSKKHLNLRENSKNIFTNLVSVRTNSKEKQKPQRLENKIQNKLNSQPSFDMYGSSSPKEPKELKVFTVENTQLQESNNIKVPMKSFSSHQSGQDLTGAAKESIQNHLISNSSSSLNQRTSWPHNFSESRLAVKMGREPLKYEHSIKVTPIQRHNSSENGSKDFTAFLRDNINVETQSSQNTNIKNMRNERRNSTNSEKNMHLNKTKPMCSISPLLEKPKAAAHVVLDFDGKVIYCTNSLDRKNLTTSSLSNGLNSKPPATVQDSAPQNVKEVTYHRPSSLQFMQANSTCSIYSNGKSSVSKSNFSPKPTEESMIHSSMHNSWVPPLNDQEMFATTFIDNTISGEKKEYTSKNFLPGMDSNPHSAIYSYSDSSHKYSMPPNPNISGLPDAENLLTQYNVNRHSKRMERLSLSPNESNTNNSFENKLLKPPLHQKAVDNHEKTAKQQSTMSTEDLFAVIHSCKKRLNIKTDSEISLASSSRSSSPSYIRPSSSKGTLAETGFLSPRNGCDTPGYRKSWADFRSTAGSERKSLASDRLGPTKPTSMHDFKMLLLQARSSNKSPGPRKSAVEMLKVSSPQETSNRINELPYNLSPRNSISFPVQNSSPELYFSNGHSTVPFKRGNRTRSSLQTRYTIYPPIFEDCSEEYENCHDLNLQNHTTKTLKETETEISNKHSNTTTSCNGGFINSRHWI